MPLSPSIVDAGGYTGDFSQFCLDAWPTAKITIYEPVDELARGCEQRFAGKSNVAVKRLALAARAGTTQLLDPGSDAGRIPDRSNVRALGRVVSTVDAAQELALIGSTNLLALNVEGSEYEILRRLVETGEIRGVENLAVQFHRIRGHRRQFKATREALAKTHECVFAVPFVWELWRRSVP